MQYPRHCLCHDGQPPTGNDRFWSGAQAQAELCRCLLQPGKARTALGDTKGAIADFNQAIKFDPALAEAYENRGILYSQTGNKPAALVDLRQAAQLFQKQGDRDSYQQTLEFIQQVQQQ